jgi:hypothetical protein
MPRSVYPAVLHTAYASLINIKVRNKAVRPARIVADKSNGQYTHN